MADAVKTATVIPGEYAFATLIQPDTGTRPEPTAEERERARVADQILLSELLRVTGWTPEELARAQQLYGFPHMVNRKQSGNILTRKYEPFYSRTAIHEWFENFFRFATSVPQSLATIRER